MPHFSLYCGNALTMRSIALTKRNVAGLTRNLSYRFQQRFGNGISVVIIGFPMLGLKKTPGTPSR